MSASRMRIENSCTRDRRGWTRTITLFAVALFEVQGGIASAQDADPRGAARLHVGPVYISPTLELRNIGVDTNVYNDVDQPTKDFVVTIVPAFVATVGPPRASLSLRSETPFVYFATQASERSINEDLTLSAQGTFGRFTPFGEFGYLNTRERVSFEVDARARRVEHRGTAGVRVALTPKLLAEVRGEFWKSAFESGTVFDDHGLAAELNRESHTFTGGINYRLTPLTAISVFSDVSNIRFTEASFRDTDSNKTLVGVELNPRALISGSARVGYQRFRPRDATLPDFNGVVGDAGVSYRLGPSTSIGFTFNRTPEFSYFVLEPYYVRDGYGLSVRRQLPAQWDVEVDVERTSHRYLQVLLTQGDIEEGHRETLLGGNVTLGYDVGPRTRMTLNLGYQNRYSDFDNRRYDGLRVGASIFYGF